MDPGSKAGMTQEEADGLTRKQPARHCLPSPRAGPHTIIAANRDYGVYREVLIGPGSPQRSARDDSERKPIG